jgi:hypothetical protein
MTDAYPLAWPEGWPRTRNRKSAAFGKTERVHSANGPHSWNQKKKLSIADGTKRVQSELEKLGVRNVRDDTIISTNLRLNLSGLPRGDQGEPGDPGVAVYWQMPGKPMRVMAIDAYTRVADNLAAIAATLEAMRAIERHGGAQILDRAFTGFLALPSSGPAWHVVLGVQPNATPAEINAAYRRKAAEKHPDTGGSHAAMAELNVARDEGLRAREHA